VNPSAKGRGGKGGSKGKAGRRKGSADSADNSLGGRSKGSLKGLRSDKGKGKCKVQTSGLPLAAQECRGEPKCVMILQQRYGCQVGDVLDIEGQSKDGRNWLEARRGGRTLPKCHEGVGWKKLHGDVGRPDRIRVMHHFCGCSEDVVLRVEGETEDHRGWLTECGKEIPKTFINVYWYEVGSSCEEHQSDDDSSSGHDYSGHQSSDSAEDHRVPSNVCLADALFDHERFPDYLRDSHPDLDSDGLEDLYHGMLQDDAEEFAGYQCDSD